MIWILAAATAYVWDNDGGLAFYEPEVNERVGCEYNLVRALKEVIGAENVEVGTGLPPLKTLLLYDMLFIVNGWRDDEMIRAEERDTIRKYLEAGNCVYMEGNNVNAVLSKIDPYFILDYFGTKYVDQDVGYGYMDSIIGHESSFAAGVKYLYPAGTGPDTTPDIIVPASAGADTGFISYDSRKAYSARGVSFTKTSEEKTVLYKTINVSFDLGALRSADPTVADSMARKILMARIVTFFGYGKVLLVQDDATHDYSSSSVVEQDLRTRDVTYALWEVPAESPGPSFKVMCNHSIVIWCCGKEDRYTLLAADTLAIKKYLNNGGCLFITGENIAYELSAIGWKGYLGDVFGVYFVQNGIALDGVYGDDFLRGLRGRLVNPASPDQILPEGNGFPVVYGITSKKADPVEGIENESFPGGGKSVFYSFDYSTIEDGVREDFLQNTLEEFYYTYPPLAVNFVSFNALVTGGEVILRFVKESDCGVERWMIERRREGEEWVRIWEDVSASSRREVVEVKDTPPSPGRYVYRIGGIKSGEEVWFSTVEVMYRPERSTNTSVFAGEVKRLPETAEVFDIAGKKVKKIEKPGIYFIREKGRTRKIILLR